MRFLYYNGIVANVSRSHSVPGMKRFSLYSTHVGSGPGVMFLDRTGTIKTPIKNVSTFPIPAFKPLRASLEEVCDARARTLLHRAETLGVRLYVLYSGGIDSTLMLVSFLKWATPVQRENMTILLSERSIQENPNFFYEHIRGKLTIGVSTMFHYVLGTKVLIVGAELNDLLFGSDFMRPFIRDVSLRRALQPYDRNLIRSHFAHKLEGVPNAEKEADFYVGILEKIKGKAPIPIESNYDFLWWASFCTKWQFISVRLLAFTADRNASLITKDYVSKYYSHFFDTEDFQLWSMSNLDKRIKDDWKTYKWPCKDIIFDYTKDADYRDTKTKNGSLGSLLMQQDPFHYIDESYGLHRNLAVSDYTDPDNDFV